MTELKMQVNLGGLLMKNPVATASGTYGFGLEYKDYIDISQLGAIVGKGTTLLPKAGNAPPRMAETPAGMLNSVGLENPGLEAVIRDVLPKLRPYDVPLVMNISGNTAEEYGEMAARLTGVAGVAALEVNISCPNVKMGGLAFGTDPRAAALVTETVRKNTSLPVIVKLSPNVGDIAGIAKSVEAAGATAISLINTILGMAIDIRAQKPLLANIMGGLSGPAVKPVALRMVWQVAQAVKIPLMGIGGISIWQDAVEFLLAGASAVQVGTANFVDPQTPLSVLRGIEDYLRENGYSDIKQIIGLARSAT
ncbi:MAG: dihydroorotate dehydrogenase [Clostridiales bacterium]|nr:dihydroorotate dehydrogenase [Clostridiales bacterium]